MVKVGHRLHGSFQEEHSVIISIEEPLEAVVQMPAIHTEHIRY